jgi:hypothetical protein
VNRRLLVTVAVAMIVAMLIGALVAFTAERRWKVIDG